MKVCFAQMQKENKKLLKKLSSKKKSKKSNKKQYYASSNSSDDSDSDQDDGSCKSIGKYETDTKLSAKLNVNHTYESTAPIKFAQISYSTEQTQVVKGEGLVIAVLAVLTNSHSKNRKAQALRVLLDRGSDGDLLFVREALCC